MSPGEIAAIWCGIVLNAIGMLGAAFLLMGKLSAKSEEHEGAIEDEKKQREEDVARERRDRERGDQETRQLAELVAKNAALLSDKLLSEINDELRRMRHDMKDISGQMLNLVEQTARSDGRREVYEELVKKVLERTSTTGR